MDTFRNYKYNNCVVSLQKGPDFANTILRFLLVLTPERPSIEILIKKHFW